MRITSTAPRPPAVAADEIVEAALQVALNMEGETIDDLQVNVTQVMVSLGEHLSME